jgi:hypothetical protein
METTGTGKGSKPRKSADDKAYRENLAKVKFEEKEDLPFKLTVNGKVI